MCMIHFKNNLKHVQCIFSKQHELTIENFDPRHPSHRRPLTEEEIKDFADKLFEVCFFSLIILLYKLQIGSSVKLL